MEKESESSTFDFASSNHTCITCRVVFARGELQREHYKSDWHRYNLKRKVAELPPVTAAIFQSKVLAQRQLEEETTKDVSYRCDCCYKTFQSKETYESHCRSKKHLDALAKSKNEPKAETPDKPETKETAEAVVEESPMDVKENDEDWETDEEGEDAAGDDGIPSTVCLFCSHSSSSVEENLSHMSVRHGFFIPDAEYCTDGDGLLTYLGAKVGMGFVCMWCNERSRAFQTLDAVRNHMRDKAHCKMLHEGEAMLEYAKFFDYSSSYPEEHRQRDTDMELDDASVGALQERGWQLVLPSGATIGHRSLMRFYRQNLKSESQVQLANTKRNKLATVLNQYRALGWTGTTGEAATRKAKDIAAMHKIAANVAANRSRLKMFHEGEAILEDADFYDKREMNTSGIIIRLQRLPMEANSADVREFFHGLRIPDGGVHIIGGREGDAFIAFSNDEDARQAVRLDGKRLKSAKVKVSLSSRSELQQVVEKANQEMKMHQATAVIVSQDRPRDARRRSTSRSPERFRNQHHHQHQNRRSRSRSPIDRGAREGGQFEGSRHHHPQRNDPASSTILEVGNIPHKATQRDLRVMFESFRPVEIRRLFKRLTCNAKLVSDTAFVVFETRNDADNALLNAARRLFDRDVRMTECGRTTMDAAFQRAPSTPPESVAEWIVREPSTNDDQQQHPPVSQATNNISPSSPLNVVPASTSAQSCVNEEGEEFGSSTDSDRAMTKERTNIGVGLATVRPYVAEESNEAVEKNGPGDDNQCVEASIAPCQIDLEKDGSDDGNPRGASIGPCRLVTKATRPADDGNPSVASIGPSTETKTEEMEKNGSDDGNPRDASIGPCRLVTKATRPADGDNPSVASIGPSTESKTVPAGGNLFTVPRGIKTVAPTVESDDEVEYIKSVDVSTKPKPKRSSIDYVPVSDRWRQATFEKFGFSGEFLPRSTASPRPISLADTPTKAMSTYVTGDGYCFYRSIAHVIVGREDQFAIIRAAIIHELHQHPEKYLSMETLDEYYARRRKKKIPDKWATSVETDVAANILRTPIFVFDVQKEMWVPYYPIDGPATSDAEAIFLVNISDEEHYQPIYRRTPNPKPRSKPLEKPKPLKLAKQHADGHHSAQSQLLIQPAVAGVGGYASLGGPSVLDAIPHPVDVGGGHLSQQGATEIGAHVHQSIIHHHGQQQQHQMSNMNHAGGDGTTAVTTDEILETMEQINRSIETGQFSTTLAGHIFRLYGYLKHVGELLEQSHKGEIDRVFDTLRQARSHHLGEIGLSSRLNIRQLEDLRAGWRPTINEFNPISANETMCGGDMEKLGAAPVSTFPMNPFAFNMQPGGGPVASAAELVSSAAAVAAASMTPSQGPSYYLIPASHVGHTQAGIAFISPTAAGNVLPPPPISPMAASHAAADADQQQQRLHMAVTASLSQPVLSGAGVDPNTSPPNFPKGAVTKTSGKYSHPAKIPGKSQYRDEVVIRNADSEIKRRRFEKVPQGAKERTLTSTGPTEESIDHGKILIEETIRQNVSPIRGEGVDGEEHVRDGEDGSEKGEDGKERRTSEDDNREFTIETGQLGEMLKLQCNDPESGNQGLRRTTTDDAARDQARKEGRKSMPTLDNQRLLAMKQSSPPKIDGTREAGEGDPALSTGIEELENAADDEGGKSNKPLTLTMMIAPPIGKQKASSAARSTPNLAATGLNKRDLCLTKSVDASGRGSGDGVGDGGQVETKFMADESGGGTLVIHETKNRATVRVVYTREFVLQCAASPFASLTPAGLPWMSNETPDILRSVTGKFDAAEYEQRCKELKQH